MSEETIEKTFQVADPARLIISNIRGSIIIEVGEAGVIEVKAVKHDNFNSDRFTVEMSQADDGTVRVETRSTESWFGFMSHPPKVDYTVRVPQGTDLKVSCVSSTLNVSGLEGVFKFKTVSGDMHLEKLTGSFKFGAVSGDITGSHLAGSLDLNTVSGRVSLTDSTFPSADVSTVSGGLILQTPVSDGPYQFNSVSGSVRMLVPADTHCNVELHSVSGNIRSSLPATATKSGHGLKETQIQGGGTLLRLKSVSGGVSIEAEGMPATSVRAAEPAAAEPVPPVPPVESVHPGSDASPSTSEILQRIERGELTVEEALKLMKGQP
jgi:hypothetical protein